MQKLIIKRGPSTDEGTFGEAWLEGGPVWRSGELPDRQNHPQTSRIPAGVYHALMVRSPHFGRMLYTLTRVPGRANILIHKANFCGDTSCGLKADLLGCIGLGMDVGPLNVDGHTQTALLRSGEAFDAFMLTAGGQELEVTIEDPV